MRCYIIRKGVIGRNKDDNTKFTVRLSHKLARVVKIYCETIEIKPKQFIKRINPVVLGWANYYTHTNASKAFNQVQWHLVTRVQNFLRYQKHRGKYGCWLYPASYLFQQLGLVKITGRIRYVWT